MTVFVDQGAFLYKGGFLFMESIVQQKLNINDSDYTTDHLEPLLELNNISKSFSPGDIPAVKDVNLTINKGEFISFVGPSGCGKSTLFKIIAGLSTPTAGNLIFANSEARDELGKYNISYVFQDSTLLPWCSVIDNVALPLKLKKIDKQKRYERAEATLELVGLEDYKNAL